MIMKERWQPHNHIYDISEFNRNMLLNNNFSQLASVAHFTETKIYDVSGSHYIEIKCL